MKLFQSKWLKRSTWGILGLVLAVILYGLLQLIDPVQIAPIVRSAEPLRFSGEKLLVASDADMVATAYADAKLDRVEGIEDTLTVISLPLNPDNPVVATAPVPNSVMSWPQIIATSLDGTKAYVVEVRGTPPSDVQQLDTIEEMPDGSRMTVIDIANPVQPTIIESVEVGRNPSHIAISPDGRFLAIDLDEPGRELLLIRLNSDGTLGERSYFSIPNSVGKPSDVNSVSWHPSGRFLALNLDNRSVAFYEVLAAQQSRTIDIQPYGAPIEAGNWLSAGWFTPDGRFYLIPDLKWRTWGAIRQLNYLMNPKGEIVSIRFDGDSSTVVQPEIVSRTEVGLGPEGLAISPDGSLVVTVNMRRTYLPDFLPAWRGKSHSSLSLLTLNPDSGQLNFIEEYGFEGSLPEDAVFDTGGEFLAVVIYNYREPNPRTGAVEFWTIVQGATPSLERTGFKIEVTRGSHAMALVSPSTQE